jgi:membrane protease YdiL (CAAX protease family)
VFLGALLVVLALMNLWVHFGPSRAHLVTGPVATAALLVAARWSGLSWPELGLGRGSLLRGLAFGAVAAGAMAAVYAVGVAIPATRGAFRDVRYRIGPGAAMFVSLVTIPLATVLFEEVAFRGVLWAELRVQLDAAAATLLSAALFGLWHVLPELDLTRTSTAVRGSTPPSRSRVLLTVLGTVAFTAVAGVVFAELRRRSGSLVAPAVLHWAANGLGVLAAARVWAMADRATAQPAEEGSPDSSGDENSSSR